MGRKVGTSSFTHRQPRETYFAKRAAQRVHEQLFLDKARPFVATNSIRSSRLVKIYTITRLTLHFHLFPRFKTFCVWVEKQLSPSKEYLTFQGRSKSLKLLICYICHKTTSINNERNHVANT